MIRTTKKDWRAAQRRVLPHVWNLDGRQQTATSTASNRNPICEAHRVYTLSGVGCTHGPRYSRAKRRLASSSPITRPFS